MSYITRIRLFLFTAITLLGAQSANAFPTGGGGCFFCSPYTFGGSTITFDLTSNDENDLAPITFNFLKYPSDQQDSDESTTLGKLCLSGKIRATIVTDTDSGEATYDLLGSDGTSRGICYKNVIQTCNDVSSANVGSSCTVDKCEYEYADPLHTTSLNIAELLDGRFKVDTTDTTVLPFTGDGPYLDCLNSDPPPFCDFLVGFGFNGVAEIPANFFPATVTLNNEPVGANEVLYANEVCVECLPGDVGETSGTIAFKSKSDKFRACEALVLKADWCNDMQSKGSPNCIGDPILHPNNPPIGGMNTAMGDFQIQDTTTICVSDMEDLRTLPSCDSETAIAACSGGPGYITYPESSTTTACDLIVDGDGNPIVDSNGNPIQESEEFTFSSAEGGGTSTTNIAAIGANPGAPGYIGDNTIPPILAGWTAIISTPDNQVNIWNFSETDMFKVAFIHSRNNDDEITGSKGDDTILGGSGADWLYGHNGNDILQGGDNVDQLFGDDGDDLLLGYACDGPNANCSSFLNKGSEDDVLSGGAGDDCLDGGRGNDSLTGDGGSDAFVLFGTVGNDTITDYTFDTVDENGDVVVKGDVIVDLTGSGASASYNVVNKKDGISACEISTGGNNVITVNVTPVPGEDFTDEDACLAINANIMTDLPAQCTGHPSSF